MAMYDDLIKQLRYCADATTCRNCFWKTECCPTDMQKKAADAIEELRKAVLRLEDESGIYDELPLFYIYSTKWIPVTERLPEPFESVFVYLFTAQSPYIAWINENGAWETEEFVLDDFDSKPTAWMPLPDAQKDGET